MAFIGEDSEHIKDDFSCSAGEQFKLINDNVIIDCQSKVKYYKEPSLACLLYKEVLFPALGYILGSTTGYLIGFAHSLAFLTKKFGNFKKHR